MSFPFGAHSLLFLYTTLCFTCTVGIGSCCGHTHTIMTLIHPQLMIKYPSSSRHNSRPAHILSLTQNIAVILAECAKEVEEARLLEEAEELLPQQAPPEPSSGLIGYSGPENARCCCAQYSDTPCGVADAADYRDRERDMTRSPDVASIRILT